MNAEETLDAMSKDERSVLVYLESRCVDHGGSVLTEQLNGEDMVICKKWNSEGLIRFYRISSRFFDHHSIRISRATYAVELTEIAFECAAIERRRRAKRSQLMVVAQSLEDHESKKASKP